MSQKAPPPRADAFLGDDPIFDRTVLALKHRRKIEEPFGWARTGGGMAWIMCRGEESLLSRFILTMAADDRPERHCDHIIYLGDGTALWFWAYFRDLSVKGATILTVENRYQWCN